jgi:Lon-like protease
MSQPDSPEPVAARRRFRFRPSDLLFPLFLAVVVLGVLELIPSSGYVIAPGVAQPVAPMIAVQGHPRVRTKGQLYLTDVTLYSIHHLLERLYWKLNPNADFYPVKDIAGNLSESQYLQYNTSLMDTSQEQAAVAALRAVPGYASRISNDGPQIVFVESGVPASRLLHPGDLISAIDGKPVHTSTQVPPYIQQVKPGAKVRLTIRRRKKTLHLAVPTVPSNNGVPAKHGKTPLIGIQVQDKLVLPLKISINAGSIGGPSAGLMFTLGIVQRLEHRDLTHGCKIVGTGTIDANGTIGPIGGAKQKIVAARAVGARYFLVPHDTQDIHDAMSAHGSIKVVPVRTLAAALAFLKHLKPCT